MPITAPLCYPLSSADFRDPEATAALQLHIS